MKRNLIVPVAALSLVLTGCSSKASSDDNQSSGDVKTGNGVTDTTINVGTIVPMSGPIGGLGQDGLAAAELYFASVNDDGGVCDRDIKVVSRDNKNSTQETMTQYTAIRSDIVSFFNISPGADAITLKDRLSQDHLAVLVGSYDQKLLAVPQLHMPGAPFDVEVINGVNYLIEQGVLAEGDTLGLITYAASMGPAFTEGAEGAADQFNLNLERVEVDPTATDVTAQVNTLRRAGAKVILMGTTGAQTVAAAAVAKASDYDVTILASNLLSSGDFTGSAKEALQEHVILTNSSAPLSSDAAGIQDLRTRWEAAYPDREITTAAEAGFLMAKITTSALEQACSDGDLTPDGVLNALDSMGKIDTEGLAVDLDYSSDGPPSLQTFILKPDPDVFGGVSIAQEPSASEAATQYAADKGYGEK